MTLIYGYAQNVTKVSAASIMRTLQRKIVTQKKSTALSAGEKCMEQTEMSTEEKAGKSAKLALESRYGVAVLTEYSDKMMVAAMDCVGINVVSILHPFT